jgi:cytochrome P450
MTKMATAPLDELLVSTDFLADPYPILHRMREEDPVHWSDAIGAWMVTRYDDIVPTFRDVSRFSNEGRLAKTV